MRRALLLCAVPVLGLLGLLLAPQEAQAQRYGGGRGAGWYGGDIGFYQGYYGNPYGWYGYSYPGYTSSYYYPSYGYSYYDNSAYTPVYSYQYPTQTYTYAPPTEGQNQLDIIYDEFGQPWDVAGETPAANPKLIFLEVRIPANAQLWIDNQETKMRGTNRMFVSPPVAQGKDYTYELKAQWNDVNGGLVTRTRNVTVRAGQITPVDMMNTQPSVRQPSVQQPNSPQPAELQPTTPQPTSATLPGLPAIPK